MALAPSPPEVTVSTWPELQSYDSLTEVDDQFSWWWQDRREMVTGHILVDGTKGSFETRCLCYKCGVEPETHRICGHCVDRGRQALAGTLAEFG